MARFALALLTGLALGLAAGLSYAYVISPVEYTDISPAALIPDRREEYLILAASAYVADGDLDRVQARLAALADPDIARAVTALAQRAAAEGRPPDTVSALSALALALGVGPGPAPATAPGSLATPSISRPPTFTQGAPTAAPSTPTLFATHPALTPTALPVYEYELAKVEKVCDASLGGPLIQAQVQTADGKPIPGVEVLIVWDGGRDHFFTGFKPDIGLGYGDFAMTPETTYTVSLSARSQSAEGLFAEPCDVGSGANFLGSWLVVFRRLP